jgi:hypothetical protein
MSSWLTCSPIQARQLGTKLERRELVKMTPELFDAYRHTERKLTRDLNAPEALGLIVRVPEGWVPFREQIMPFRTLRRIA